MVFSSLFFLYAFFPASLIAYALCRSLKAKNVSLLVFSLIFYAWGEPKYVLLLMGMALFDWFFALRIDATDKTSARKLWLTLAVITDLGLIGFFKYSGMVCSLFGPPPAFVEKLALPIGISFYTFQLLTYVVDVYRGEARAQRQYWHVLLYAALFHQCIAGPIVRYQSIATELFEQRSTGADLGEGVLRFTLGLTKKVLLANPCGALADQMLLTEATAGNAALFAENLRHLSGQSVLGLWLGVLAFTLQIYLDFSAYSDMAIGMGKMLGLHYKENFDHPYISRSATEFWRRWHISLGSFFRDYVYIPLGGSRCSTPRTLLNLLVVWALTGLWHGASWNFVLWGLYWFVFAAAERVLLRRLAGKLPGFLKIPAAHGYLLLIAMLGWVLFRFTNLGLAVTVVRGLFGGNGNPLTDFQSVVEGKSSMFLLAFCVVASTPVFRTLRLRWAEKAVSGAGKTFYQAVVYGILPAAMLLVSTAGLVGNSYNPFLYFKF